MCASNSRYNLCVPTEDSEGVFCNVLLNIAFYSIRPKKCILHCVQCHSPFGDFNDMTHRYTAFGLRIESDIELFQLKQDRSAEPANLSIVLGDVSTHGFSQKLFRSQPHCQAHDGAIWLSIPETCRFLIEGGNKITIDAPSSSDMQTVKLYLLGSGFGAILQQRGMLVLHGNAIEIGDFAFIVVAHSGVGKSTLAAEFFRRGFRLLADDVCAVDNAGFVYPSYPYLKVWQDAMERMQLSSEGVIRIRLQQNKYYIPLNNSFCDQRKPIGHIFRMTRKNHDCIEFRELQGLKKSTCDFNQQVSRRVFRTIRFRNTATTRYF